MKQLRLRTSSTFDLKADAVEKSDGVLLLVHVAELSHDMSGPSCKMRHRHTQDQESSPLLFCTPFTQTFVSVALLGKEENNLRTLMSFQFQKHKTEEKQTILLTTQLD